MLKSGTIINNKGVLEDQGTSFEEVKRYNKENIPSYLRSRLKEWDYYSFMNQNIGFLLTIANNSYLNYVSFSLIDFQNKKYITKMYVSGYSKDKIKLPLTPSKGDIEISDKKYFLSVKKSEGKIKIIAKLNKFVHSKDLYINLDIEHQSENHSIYILHPFKNKHHFYYNFKENLLSATGTLKLDEKIDFKGYGVYDWGRGIWPYKVEWYRISATIEENGELKSINLGCGFGTTKENENVLYVNNEKFKLSKMALQVPKNDKNKIDYMKKWVITSKDDDINLSFTPLLNRKDELNLLILSTKQNQVFGHFNGTINAKNKKYIFKNAQGFIEHFKNRW